MIFVIKKRLLIIIGSIMLFLFAAAGVTAIVASAMPKADVTVLLDAGHGGFDGGTIGITSGVKEAEINLAITKKVKELLEKQKVNVVMTRTDNNACAPDKQSDMRKRKEIILETEPDIVISIHCNKFPNPTRRGAQVFYETNSTEGKALAKLIQTNLNISNKTVVQKEFQALSGDYYMTRVSPYPSAIVECGFLSSPEDDTLLNSPEHQQKIAEHIVAGIMAYLVNKI